MLGVCLAVFDEGRVGFGDDVLVFDRYGGDLDAEELCRALGVVAGGGDDVFGVDGDLFFGRNEIATLFDHLRAEHVPMVAGPGIAVDLPFALDGDTALAGTLGHGLGHVGRVYVAVGGVIDRALQVVGAHERPAFPDLIGCHPFVGNAAGLGRGGVEHVFVHAVLRLGHAQVPDHVEAGVEAGFRLEGLVEIDRVLVDVGCGVGHVEERQETRRVPCRPRGQLVAFEKHHVGPARFRKVIGDGGADRAAADDKCFDMGFHETDSFPFRARFNRNLRPAVRFIRHGRVRMRPCPSEAVTARESGARETLAGCEIQT